MQTAFWPDTTLVPELDPWWDIYIPATLGEEARVRAAIASMTLPDGNMLAVASRAMEVLQRVIEARRLANRALQGDGVEVRALATFVMASGEEIARQRLWEEALPGHRADAGCDLAVLCLKRGNLEAAVEALQEGQKSCPLHLETRRWQRFLAEDPDPVATARRFGRGLRQPREACGRDITVLFPVRRSGWLSTERFRRRVMTGLGQGRWLGSGSALGQLQNIGVGECYFATPREYSSLKAAHVLVELEVLADQLLCLCEEERPVLEQAHMLVHQAAGLDQVASADAAGLVASAATQRPELKKLALESVQEQLQRCVRGRAPGGWEESVWQGWAAWLGESVAEARQLLGQLNLHPIAWQLAVDCLRVQGEAVDTLLEDALDHPVRAGLASTMAGGESLKIPPWPRLIRRNQPSSTSSGT
jgi:hypothetical protein